MGVLHAFRTQTPHLRARATPRRESYRRVVDASHTVLLPSCASHRVRQQGPLSNSAAASAIAGHAGGHVMFSRAQHKRHLSRATVDPQHRTACCAP